MLALLINPLLPSLLAFFELLDSVEVRWSRGGDPLAIRFLTALGGDLKMRALRQLLFHEFLVLDLSFTPIKRQEKWGSKS